MRANSNEKRNKYIDKNENLYPLRHNIPIIIITQTLVKEKVHMLKVKCQTGASHGDG